MSTKLITSTCLQLLRRYDKRPESQRASLLEDVSFFSAEVHLGHDTLFLLKVKLSLD